MGCRFAWKHREGVLVSGGKPVCAVDGELHGGELNGFYAVQPEHADIAVRLGISFDIQGAASEKNMV